MNEEMNELKPCPYCGNEPQGNVWHTYGKKPYDETLYFCTNPKCREFMKKAIPLEQWNTRPIEDKLNARIVELKAFIDQLIEAGNELTTNPAVGNYEQREAAWTKLWLKWRMK